MLPQVAPNEYAIEFTRNRNLRFVVSTIDWAKIKLQYPEQYSRSMGILQSELP